MSEHVKMVHGGVRNQQDAGTLPDESSPTGVSVIIPTLNEVENVCRVVSRCFDALEEYPTEVIVVDDNSSDRTAGRAQEQFSDDERVSVVCRTGDQGLTRSVLDGFRRARYDYWAVLDADLQHPPEKLPDLLAEIDDGAALAIGSRYVEGGGIKNWSPWHRLVSWGGTTLARFLLPSVRTVNDPLSGFFIVRRDVIDRETIDMDGYKILLEILTKGDYDPNAIVEVPYVFSDREHGESNRTLAEYRDFLRRLVKLRKYKQKDEPDASTATVDRERGCQTQDADRNRAQSDPRPALVSAYPPENDGLAEYAQALVTGYIESGGAVTVVGTRVDMGANSATEHDGVYLRRDWNKNSLRGLYDITHSLWESTSQYDFIHFNAKPTYIGSGNVRRFLALLLPLLARLLFRKPIVVTMHDLLENVEAHEVEEKIGPIERVGATLATQAVLFAGPVTVTSERYRRVLENKYPVGEVYHVPHGTRQRDGTNQAQTDPFRLLLFGYISPYKDYETVFSAFDALRAQRDDIELWIVGGANPEYPEHAERIRSAAADRLGVRFFGYVDDEMLSWIFDQTSVLIIPYLTAPGVSGPYQEAKAHGLPTIVYDKQDVLAATVQTGGTAAIVPPEDPEALQAEVARLIETPDLLAEMAESNAEAADTTMTDVAHEITRIALDTTNE